MTTLVTGAVQPSRTNDVDLAAWCASSTNDASTVVTIPEGVTVTLQTQSAQPPVKDIYVKVTAKRIVKNVENQRRYHAEWAAA